MATHAIGLARKAKEEVALRDNGDGSDLQAPVCHLPPTSDIPEGAGLNLPAIPAPDGTIEGMMNSLNSLIQGYNGLAGFGPFGGASASASASGGAAGGFKTKDQKGGRFIERSRQTKKVRVTNPDDENQWVDVMVITALTMVDTKTGETWDWTRGS